MLRHGVHRAASQITLEFLLPTTIKHTKSCLRASYRKDHPRSISSAYLTPKVSTILEKVPPLNEAAHSLVDTDVDFYNNSLPELYASLSTGNVQGAWEIWQSLADRHLLRLLGPPQYETYSRQLIRIYDKRKREPFDAAEREAVDEMAIFVAGGGHTLALKVCMLHHIEQGQLDAVHALYARYLEVLQSKAAWKEEEGIMGDARQELEEGETEEVQGHPETTDFEASLTRPQENLLKPPTTPQGRSVPLVRPDILLCVIVAYTLRDDFRGALRAVLQSGVRVPHNVVADILLEIKLEPALRAKLGDWIFRLDIGRLLSRNLSLTTQLANLTRDLADKSLERIYKGIITELSRPDPWVTTKPSEVSERKLVLMPEFAWISFLRGFLQCRSLELAETLWNDMSKFGVQPTVAIWTALIDGYASLRMADSAVAAWNIMLKNGIKPDALSYRAIIYGMFHSGFPDEGMVRFREFEKSLPRKPQGDEYTVLIVYNTVLHGLLFHSDVTGAKAVLEKMQERGPKPDIVSFNTFMRYYGRKGDLKAFASILQMVDAAGLVGDEFTFSTLLTTLLKVRKDATEVMFGLMRKQGIEPNVATYTTIIGHQVKQPTISDFRAALEILQKMEAEESEAAKPNEITYTTFLTGILRADWMDASTAEEWLQDITERMRRRNITPKRPTYHILIRACLDNPDPRGVQNALRYYRDMMARRVAPDNGTWYILLVGLMQRNEWELARELVDDLLRMAFVPSGSLSDVVNSVKRGPGSRRRYRLTSKA